MRNFLSFCLTIFVLFNDGSWKEYKGANGAGWDFSTYAKDSTFHLVIYERPFDNKNPPSVLAEIPVKYHGGVKQAFLLNGNPIWDEYNGSYAELLK